MSSRRSDGQDQMPLEGRRYQNLEENDKRVELMLEMSLEFIYRISGMRKKLERKLALFRRMP